MIDFAELNAMPKERFVEALKDIFEHSPWVPDRSADARPFSSVRALHGAMNAVVLQAAEREQLELIRAHPDLAGKAAMAGDLTESSTEEQKGAGLDRLSPDEMERFTKLNDAYMRKFGFPFIIAVKGHDKHSILDAFGLRLQNDQEQERNEALNQISDIARFRLEALLQHSD